MKIKIQAIKNLISTLLTNSLLWRVTGFVSSIVGFPCFAISPCFQHLFGQWTPLKIVIYTVLTSVLSILTLFFHKCTSERVRNFLSRAQVGFLVLTLTSLWSVLEERSEEGKVENGYEKMMKLTSTVAFAMMALSWSRLLQLGFEVGLFNFFSGCFLVTVKKMSLKLATLAAFLCFLLVNIRNISDYLHKRSPRAAAPQTDDRSAEVPFRPVEEEVPVRYGGGTAFNGANPEYLSQWVGQRSGQVRERSKGNSGGKRNSGSKGYSGGKRNSGSKGYSGGSGMGYSGSKRYSGGMGGSGDSGGLDPG